MSSGLPTRIRQYMPPTFAECRPHTASAVPTCFTKLLRASLWRSGGFRLSLTSTNERRLWARVVLDPVDSLATEALPLL